jgi:hypothetical protein
MSSFSTVELVDAIEPVWGQFGPKHPAPRSFAHMHALAAQLRQDSKQDTKMETYRQWRAQLPSKIPPDPPLPLFQRAQKQVALLFFQRGRPSLVELARQHGSRILQQQQRKTGVKRKLDESAAPTTSFGISPDMLHELSRWIDRCPTNMPARTAVEILVAFGASPSALMELDELSQDFETWRKTKKPALKKLTETANEAQFTAKLYTAFCALWTQHVDLQVFTLPAHYATAQVRAIRWRFDLKPDDPLPREALMVHLCRRCDRIYTLYNDRNEVLYAKDCFGFKSKVEYDFITGDTICMRDSVIAHSDFKHEKLLAIDLFAKVLVFRKRVFFFCPGCSMLCALDPTVMTCTDDGFICTGCTRQALGIPPPTKRRKKKTTDVGRRK